MGAMRKLQTWFPAAYRRGQTTVEYILVTAALTVTFFVIYKILQGFLARQFKMGGIIILRMYTQPYN